MNMLSSKIVTIRKAHNCFCCGRKFEIGTKMECLVCVDGVIYTLYTCLACYGIINSFPEKIVDEIENIVRRGDFYELRGSDPKYKGMTPEELLSCLEAEKQVNDN